jgi:hypothetical protein
MSAADAAYETYAEEVQRLVRVERDPKATPGQRRSQAHIVARAWGHFLRTFTKAEAADG